MMLQLTHGGDLLERECPTGNVQHLLGRRRRNQLLQDVHGLQGKKQFQLLERKSTMTAEMNQLDSFDLFHSPSTKESAILITGEIGREV